MRNALEGVRAAYIVESSRPTVVGTRMPCRSGDAGSETEKRPSARNVFHAPASAARRPIAAPRISMAASVLAKGSTSGLAKEYTNNFPLPGPRRGSRLQPKAPRRSTGGSHGTFATQPHVDHLRSVHPRPRRARAEPRG